MAILRMWTSLLATDLEEEIDAGGILRRYFLTRTWKLIDLFLQVG
jgi:hypothetical protein